MMEAHIIISSIILPVMEVVFISTSIISPVMEVVFLSTSIILPMIEIHALLHRPGVIASWACRFLKRLRPVIWPEKALKEVFPGP